MSRLRLVAALVVILFAIPSLEIGPAQAAPNADPSQATLTVLDGSVTVVEGASGGSRVGASGDLLVSGDRVITGDPGGALLTFFNGSEQELSAGTDVLLQQVGQTPEGGVLVQLSQAAGVTTNRVAQLGQGSSYEVQTPSVTALVRGTKFAVEVVRDPDTNEVVEEGIDVAEGTVSVHSVDQEFDLLGGHGIEIHPGGTAEDGSAAPPDIEDAVPTAFGNTTLVLSSDTGSASDGYCFDADASAPCVTANGAASGAFVGQQVDGAFSAFFPLAVEGGTAFIRSEGAFINVAVGSLNLTLNVVDSGLTQSSDGPPTYKGGGTWMAQSASGDLDGVQICGASGVGEFAVPNLQADSSAGEANPWSISLYGDLNLQPC